MRRFPTAWLLAWISLAAVSCTDGEGQDSNADDLALNIDDFNHFEPAVSRDGRFAFSKPVDGAAAIFVADSIGGTPRQITSGVWDFNPRWSPDGRWISFDRETNTFDVLIVPATGGEPIPVADGPSLDQTHDWLPDGSGLVYGTFNGTHMETWLYRLADSSRTKLLDVQGSARGVVSPDGKWVVYDLELEGRQTIWVMDMATKAHRQLTTEGFEELGGVRGVWSSDSRRVVYQSRRSGTPDIWLADIESGELRQLTRDIRGDYLPLYSPVGNRIAFLSNRGGQTDIWVVDDTGGTEVRVTDDLALEFSFSWTHDASGLVITANGARMQIFSIARSGGTPVALTSADADAQVFTLSEDGSTLVFEQEIGGDVDIYSLATAGGTPSVVASSPSRDVQPSISPDGRMVVFSSARGGSEDIFVVPASGGTARALVSWPSREGSPRWSPDGTLIAFDSNRRGTRGVWVMDSGGGNPRALAPQITVLASFRWHSGSKRILVEGADATGVRGLFEVDVASGAARQIGTKGVADGVYFPHDSMYAVSIIDQGYARIHVLNRNGEVVRALSPDGRRYDRQPRVSPSGDEIVFREYEYATDFYELSIVPVSGGTPRRLTNLKGYANDFQFSPDGQTVYFSGTQYKWLFYKRNIPVGTRP